MILLRSVVACAWFALLAFSACAAEIKVLTLDKFDNLHNGSIDVDSGLGQNMGPEGPVICNLLYEGGVEIGDLDKLKAIIDKQREENFSSTPRLCLHSPGGSYGEGLKIAQYLMEKSIGTAIPEGAACYSACAIMFMGGTYPWKGEINRFQHVQGVIGFHAPYIPDRNDGGQPQKVDETEVKTAFSDGITAMRAFMELGVGNKVKRIEPDLMQEMMARGPNDFFYVDTIGKAIRYRIHIFGVEKIPAVDDAGMCNACVNMNYGAMESYGAGAENDLCNGLSPPRRAAYDEGIRFTHDVAPRGGTCSLDVYQQSGKATKWFYVQDERDDFGDGLELAYWYLLPPNTNLATLSKPPPDAPAPDPQKQNEQFLDQLVSFVLVDYLGHGKKNHVNDPAMYADRVIYFDKGEIARDQVIADQAAYNAKWPDRSYEYIKDTIRADGAKDGGIDVSFRYVFDVSNGKEKKTGIAVSRLGVAVIGGKFVIMREAGEVERRM